MLSTLSGAARPRSAEVDMGQVGHGISPPEAVGQDSAAMIHGVPRPRKVALAEDVGSLCRVPAYLNRYQDGESRRVEHLV